MARRARDARPEEVEDAGLPPGEHPDAAPDAPETAAEADLPPDELVARLRAERDEAVERWRRAHADYQNLRRRSAGEAEDRVRASIVPFLERLLTVLDYLEMALQTPATTDEARNLATGVRLTRDQLVAALRQEGVEPIAEEGAFDPAVHEATEARAREDVEPGTILETVRRGYTWRDTVLRHAHVVVATAPEGDDAHRDAAAPEAGGETS